MSKDLNKHRQERGIDSNLHDYDRIRETINENRFSLCHLGELVSQLVSIYSNDTELGKEIRNAVNQLNSRNE